MADISYSDPSVGSASSSLVRTAAAAGEYVTLTLMSGFSVSVGWYNGAGSVLNGADVLCAAHPYAVVGPLASGDKVYIAADNLNDCKVLVGSVAF